MTKELPEITVAEMMNTVKTLAKEGNHVNSQYILNYLRDVFGLNKDIKPIAKLVETIYDPSMI